MRKLTREAVPDFLADKWQQWGLEWKQRRDENDNAQFHWHVVDGIPVNRRLLPSLKLQTQDHCSFCDGFPVNNVSVETIEHFRPKIDFPLEAYQWENLFYCCTHCQQKGDDFEEALLKPDAADYQFDRFFRWDFTSGEIKVNEEASEPDRLRAESTIRLYGLNEFHPKFRMREMHKRSQGQNDPLDDFAYRDFINYPQA